MPLSVQLYQCWTFGWLIRVRLLVHDRKSCSFVSWRRRAIETPSLSSPHWFIKASLVIILFYGYRAALIKSVPDPGNQFRTSATAQKAGIRKTRNLSFHFHCPLCPQRGMKCTGMLIVIMHCNTYLLKFIPVKTIMH